MSSVLAMTRIISIIPSLAITEFPTSKGPISRVVMATAALTLDSISGANSFSFRNSSTLSEYLCLALKKNHCYCIHLKCVKYLQ